MKSPTFARSALAAAIATISLAGCTTAPVNHADQQAISDAASTSTVLEQGKELTVRPTASSEFDGYFMLGKGYEMSRYEELPAFFRRNVLYNQAEPVTFRDLVSDISSSLNLRINVSENALNWLNERISAEESDGEGDSSSKQVADAFKDRAGVPVSENAKEYISKVAGVIPGKAAQTIRHNGPLIDLIDKATSNAGLFWEWRNDHIVVYRSRVETFHLDVLPTVSSMETKVSTNRSNTTEGGGQVGTSHSVSTSYSTPDLFSDTIEAIQQMLTDYGKIKGSKASGMVVVRDTPVVLADVGAYIERVNAMASKNIRLHTQIYEITLRDDADVGIDWEAVFSNSENVAASIGSSFVSGTMPNLNLTNTRSSSGWVDTAAAIRAQNGVLNVSTVTDNASVTKTGHPVPVQLVNEKGYLEKVEVTTTDGSSTISLTPGTVLDGVTIDMLPRILSDGSIDLQMSFDLSVLNGIEEIRVGEDGNEALIQVTDVTSKDFVNTLNMVSGETMMVAGFERTLDSSETNSIFGKSNWWAGGAKKGGKQRVMNLILVTPYILSK